MKISFELVDARFAQSKFADNDVGGIEGNTSRILFNIDA
jgi:hypothetical protein